MKYKLVTPDTALFNTAKLQKLLDIEVRQSLNSMVSVAQLSIQSETPVVTGELSRSIHTKVVNKIGLIFPAVNYAIVVEKGRDAGSRQPPPEPLEVWLRRSPRGRALFASMKGKKKKGKTLTLRQAAWILSRSIKEKGTKPNPFFARGEKKAKPLIDKLNVQLLKRLKLKVNA